MNVVLVILDSLRKDHLGVYGNDRVQTPNLDAFAGESFRFTRAYPESLPTICARRAIHTGLRTFPFRNRVELPGETFQPAGWQPIPEDQVTLSETLVAQGYYTLLYSDTQPMFHPSMNFQRGFRVFDWIRGQERDRYRPKSMAPRDVVESNTVPGNDESMVSKVQQYVANTRGRNGEEDYFAPRVFTKGMEFMESSEDGQPFFLVLDSFDPHEPWDPPEEYASMYSHGYEGPDPIVPNYGGSEWIQDGELERMRALYAGEVTMVDRWFGRFMDSMERAGRLDDTAVVILADHGVALGEHDFTGKPYNALWPELTDIPFMIRHPEGLGAGQTSDFFASTHDVAPTILGILGLLPQERMDGVYLSVLMEGGDLPARDHFTLGYADHVWARDDRYLMFSRRDRSEPHLYDLQNDPETKTDLADEDPERVRRMFDDYVLADAGGSLDG